MDQENNTVTTDNGKNAGIVSYIGPLGWLIAYFAMHSDKKTELGSYQLRQTLLLYIATAVCYFVVYILMIISLFISLFLAGFFGIVMWLVGVASFVLWVIGLIGAINGQKKPIPLIGDKAQTMFKGI
ncbi:MAG TPA: hypothetical protein VHS53_01270 [Mucilaginibacter sp.]|nr:hypothetical protein [Mucilaginibacter sp.]